MAGKVSRIMRRTASSFVGAISDKAERSIEASVMSCISEAGGDKSTLLELIASSCGDISQRYCSASAQMGAGYYDACRQAVVGEQIGAKAESQYEGAVADDRRDAFVKSIRHAIDDEGLNGSDLAQFVVNRVRYEIGAAFDYAMDAAARSDDRDVRFARVTNGVEACSFCCMVSSRGAAYVSAQNAGADNHFHKNCECVVTPVWNFKRSTTHQSAAQTWDQHLANKRGGIWVTDDIAGYSAYEELDRSYRMASKTLSNEKLDDAITEYGLKRTTSSQRL